MTKHVTKVELDELIVTMAKSDYSDRKIIEGLGKLLLAHYPTGRKLLGPTATFLFYRGLIHKLCETAGVKVRRYIPHVP